MFRFSTSGFDFRCNLILCPEHLGKGPRCQLLRSTALLFPNPPAIALPRCPSDHAEQPPAVGDDSAQTPVLASEKLG